MQFSNPLLLLGTLAFAVPLIIHLLNRQRFRRRKWAAMEFLLAAYKKQRRRLRTENLILLLLRCLLPILLALAIARPILQDSAALGALGGGAAHHVVVLDGSYSMGYAEADGVSSFERAKTVINQLIDGIEEQKGHRVTLIVAGEFPRRVVTNSQSLTRAQAALVALQRPDDSASDLGAALADVIEIVTDSVEAQPVVYVFTDLQQRALGAEFRAESASDAAAQRGDRDDDGDPTGAAADLTSVLDALDGIRATDAELLVLNMGPAGRTGGTRPNQQVTAIELSQPAAVVRVPTPVTVRLRNRADTKASLWVTLEVDENEPVRESIELEPGAEGEVEFAVVFREAGWRRLTASIDGDGLDADNACYAAVLVRERLRLLVVEGRPEADPDLRESTELLRFLDPTSGEGPPELTTFVPTVIDPLRFKTGQEDPADYDLTILANVDQLTQRSGDSLRRALEAGRGVLLLLGDQVDPSNYNLVLGIGEDGLLPGRLTSPAGYAPGGSEYYRNEVLRPQHPVLVDFRDEVYQEILQNVPVYRAVGVDRESLAEDAEVLIRLRDPQRTPLLVTRPHGSGRLMLWTSTLNARPDRWNRFEDPIVALPLLHPMAYWLTLPAEDNYNVTVGTVLTASLDHRPSDITVQLPERAGSSRAPVGGEPRPLPGDRFGLPPWTQTTTAGFYLFEMQLDRDGGREPLVQPFAVNVESGDGDLTYLAHDVAAAAFGVDQIYRGLPGEGDVGSRSGRTELGPWLLWVLLFVLLAEGSWARFVTRRRS